MYYISNMTCSIVGCLFSSLVRNQRINLAVYIVCKFHEDGDGFVNTGDEATLSRNRLFKRTCIHLLALLPFYFVLVLVLVLFLLLSVLRFQGP